MNIPTDKDSIFDAQTNLVIEAMWSLIEIQEFQKEMLKSDEEQD